MPFQLIVLRAGREGDRRVDRIANDKNFRAVWQVCLSPPGHGQWPESARPGDLLFRCEVLSRKNQHTVTLKCLLEHVDGGSVGALPQVNPFDLSPKDRPTRLAADCHG